MPATKHGEDEGRIWRGRISILTAFAFALLYQVLISHIFMTGFTEVKCPGNVNFFEDEIF